MTFRLHVSILLLKVILQPNGCTVDTYAYKNNYMIGGFFSQNPDFIYLLWLFVKIPVQNNWFTGIYSVIYVIVI